MKIIDVQNYCYNIAKQSKINSFKGSDYQTKVKNILDDPKLRQADEFIKSSIIRSTKTSESAKARIDALRVGLDKKDKIKNWNNFQNHFLLAVNSVQTQEQADLLKKIVSYDKCCDDFHTMYKLPDMIKSADSSEKAKVKSDFVDLFFDDGFDNFASHRLRLSEYMESTNTQEEFNAKKIVFDAVKNTRNFNLKCPEFNDFSSWDFGSVRTTDEAIGKALVIKQIDSDLPQIKNSLSKSFSKSYEVFMLTAGRFYNNVESEYGAKKNISNLYNSFGLIFNENK